ncbi:hypothetical protein NLG42_11190 [Flavobacterium plurextorum]|uniref:hypothetical protein n=1 Tax=Flavobacterium TaxID=237 RepID=UPI00214DA93F|nr:MULTISPECIES: hypothetical protein [Flavobacterium]UUW11348.1 hypothetical protein NLG42_11190 [Flavobacterium plurextorum]
MIKKFINFNTTSTITYDSSKRDGEMFDMIVEGINYKKIRKFDDIVRLFSSELSKITDRNKKQILTKQIAIVKLQIEIERLKGTK